MLDAHLQATCYEKISEICAYVEQTCGVKYSISGMTQWMKANGFRYKQCKAVPAKLDPNKKKGKKNSLKIIENFSPKNLRLNRSFSLTQPIPPWLPKSVVAGLKKVLKTALHKALQERGPTLSALWNLKRQRFAAWWSIPSMQKQSWTFSKNWRSNTEELKKFTSFWTNPVITAVIFYRKMQNLSEFHCIICRPTAQIWIRSSDCGRSWMSAFEIMSFLNPPKIFETLFLYFLIRPCTKLPAFWNQESPIAFKYLFSPR